MGHAERHVRLAQTYLNHASAAMKVGADVVVAPTFSSADAAAEVIRTASGFSVSFADGFFGAAYSPLERRDVVAHELGHVIFWGYQDALRAVLRGVNARRLMDAREHEAIDRLVWLARAVLPPFTLDGKRRAWR
jgi:hypothetical protein